MTDTSFDQRPFGGVEFAENPENRCPLILLLDNLMSMRGRPFEELNAGLQLFRDELFADSLGAKRYHPAPRFDADLIRKSLPHIRIGVQDPTLIPISDIP